MQRLQAGMLFMDMIALQYTPQNHNGVSNDQISVLTLVVALGANKS